LSSNSKRSKLLVLENAVVKLLWTLGKNHIGSDRPKPLWVS